MAKIKLTPEQEKEARHLEVEMLKVSDILYTYGMPEEELYTPRLALFDKILKFLEPFKEELEKMEKSEDFHESILHATELKFLRNAPFLRREYVENPDKRQTIADDARAAIHNIYEPFMERKY